MSPFITLRADVPVGSHLYCGLPGFRLPSSSGGSTWYTKFHWNPMHTGRYHSIPYHHYSKYYSRSSSTLYLTSTSITSMHTVSESSYFWKSTNGGEVLQSMRYYLYLRQYSSYNKPLLYYSGYYPKPPTNICSGSSYIYHCRVYRSFNQRRYFVLT